MDLQQNSRKLAHLQIRMFQTLFKLRLPDVGADMAFASAIADTGDKKLEAALKKNPDLVEEWLKKYSGRKTNKRYRL